MTGTMFLTIAVPSASEGNGPVEMYASDDEFNGNVLREDEAGSDSARLDLFVTAKEMLWKLPGINSVVRNALDRIQRAFAYNSVFFLKVVLDLQATYHSLSQPLPADVFLETDLVLEIAEVLAGRMVRKDKDGVSPSRELQLRTLVSALSLLYQLRIGRLGNSAYAKLLKDVSERDYDNGAKYAEDFRERASNGDVEFLVRYACDLIRCMPSELPRFAEMNSQAIHFLFAAGYINQLEGATTPTVLDSIWARITAPPSRWHRDMRHLYEGAAGAISLHHQAQYSDIGRASLYASSLAVEISRSIVDKVELGLEALVPTEEPDSGGDNSVDSGDLPSLETRLLVSGLLDLMCQLVTAFPQCSEIVDGAKSLALKLIQTSDKKEFRNKAFEIIISTTAGCSEEEYYNIMRNLDRDIENISQAGILPPTGEDESLRIEEIKREKRDAMERCEKRSFLYKGAVESMQRRLQGMRDARSPSRISQTINEVLHLQTWDEAIRSSNLRSIPSSRHSQVPTLSSQAPTCDTNPSPRSTLTRGSSHSAIGTLLSPTDSTTCKSLSSPTDSTCHTLLSRVRGCDSPIESPILPSLTPPNMTPSIPYPAPTTPHEAITPNLDTTLRFNGLDQLFVDTMFEEPELYDGDHPSENNVGKTGLELPIQSFEIEDDRSTLPLQIPEDEEEAQTSDSGGSQAINSSRGVSICSQAMLEPQTPLSTYPEPSLSRTPSGMTQTSSLKRQSRASKLFSRKPGRNSRRFHSLQLNKPLPMIDRQTVLAEEAPEPVLPGQPAQPVRARSAMEMRDEKMDYFRLESALSLSQYPIKFGLPPLNPIHCGVEPVPAAANSSIEYESQPVETVFKVQCKDSCFSTFISSDAKHAVYLSSQSFQVFSIPSPGGSVSTKPKFQYKLGSMEGLKKAKVPWTYKAGAASDKYIVVITKEKIQVHELENCKRIFAESTTGWENRCVAIAGDKMVIGMRKKLRDDTQGLLRIYKLNAPTYQGPRCERIRDLLLPLNPRAATDAPHLITLTHDGHHLTCATPRCGYFFAWDISRVRVHEPHLVASGVLKVTEGPGAEILSNATLFPDKRHIFCSTFSASTIEGDGSFTEPTNVSAAAPSPPSHRPIRQVGLRVTHSTIAPLGNAAAFLTKSGMIWILPVAYLDGDNNLTTFAALHSKERMQAHQTPSTAGRIAFSPEGDRLVAVDLKGKIVTLSFRKNCLPVVADKLKTGGFF